MVPHDGEQRGSTDLFTLVTRDRAQGNGPSNEAESEEV